MNRKVIIKKVLVLGAWFLVISGITTLLIAANRRKKDHVCREVLIGIRGTGDDFYIKKEDILELVEKTAHGSLVMQPVTTINLQKMEKVLQLNPWIKSAELYFDSKDALHVKVMERTPIARVFTTSGASFYMDSSGHRMPLLETESIRLPVVTGFTNARKLNASDSAQLKGIKQLVWFIFNDEFWNAQIGQIDITADQNFELIPVVGDHIIRIGNAENIKQKLNRLFVFYRQVMAKTGFNKYAALDVQFDRQVVAINKGQTSAIDSIQLQKNIETLMNRANFQNVEELLPDQMVSPVSRINAADSNAALQITSVSTKTHSNPVVIRPNPLKTKITQTELKTYEVKMIEPKAVMKRKEQ